MAARRTRPLLLVASVLAAQGLAVLAYLGVERWRTAERIDPLRPECVASGRAAPDLELERPDGSRFRLANLHGNPVLLHFWATWCPPCREELPGLLALGERAPDGGLLVLAVSVDDDWDAVRSFFGGAIPRGVARSSGSTAQRMYELGTLPETHLVSSSGLLLARFRGARDWRRDPTAISGACGAP